jgi:hypothetical protein
MVMGNRQITVNQPYPNDCSFLNKQSKQKINAGRQVDPGARGSCSRGRSPIAARIGRLIDAILVMAGLVPAIHVATWPVRIRIRTILFAVARAIF